MTISNFDWDNTIVENVGAIELAERAGKKKEAYKIFMQYTSDCYDIVNQHPRIPDQLRHIDDAVYRCLTDGATLLKGQPVEILRGINYRFVPKMIDQLERAKNNGGARITTLNDKRMFPRYVTEGVEVKGSRFGVSGNRLTGAMEHTMTAREKMTFATSSECYIDSMEDVGLAYKTYLLGGTVFVRKIDKDPLNDLLIKDLIKNEVDFKLI